MLQRVSNDGSYSQDFVKEFWVFTQELRDFFNAGSFKDMLTGLEGSLDDTGKQVGNFCLVSGCLDKSVFVAADKHP